MTPTFVYFESQEIKIGRFYEFENHKKGIWKNHDFEKKITNLKTEKIKKS